MIRAIIVDDEYLARQRVIKLLELYEDIHIVAEANNGSQAVEAINLKEPNLVFLDVQMPDFDGFEVLEKIDPKQKPYIVFTTAYDSYALKAFDIHALDYLLKPFDEDRFKESMTKVLQQFEVQKSWNFNKKLLRMIRDFERPSDEFIKKIIIADRGKEYHVELEEVLYLEASGNYIKLYLLDQSYLYRSTMGAMALQLNPDDFMRIHRSCIVNKRYVKKCSYLSNNEYQFTLKNGTLLLSGRSYKQIIMNYLS